MFQGSKKKDQLCGDAEVSFER